MQNKPQPTKLQRTGNKSGRWDGGAIINSDKCSRTMTTPESVGIYFVMYLSEKMSTSFLYDGICDGGTPAILLMHMKITKQQTYGSSN
mmetsp:Transcript_3015/g.6591  ORF Transcript_3015/g.6591 Transcript_3015/m.6591 type:complete len:88 (+) Transcript_3015:1493-1756(+)